MNFLWLLFLNMPKIFVRSIAFVSRVGNEATIQVFEFVTYMISSKE
jgi:hypothetical protein